MSTPNERDRCRPGEMELVHHERAIRARLARYQAFKRFLADAPTRLPRLYDSLGVGGFYRDYYSLCVTPGGAMGGRDPRTMEVFFGQRPFDVAYVPCDGPPAPVPFAPSHELRTVAERGARLLYARSDHGRVLCLLYPAQTEFSSPQESEILLGEVDPTDLDSPAVLSRHLRWLLAYMAGTSLDGIQHPGQRWRYWVLRNCHLWRDSNGGPWRPSRVFEGAYWLAKWVLTIGLSGSLLYLLQREWPLPDSVTPAISHAAERAHQDQLELRQALLHAAPPHGRTQDATATRAAPPTGTSEGDR